ncbi:MAG: hypothetical protein HC927_04625, partial [Deltaproteobacteria bacterium]|nr:hypothetical protein [Deltaproteobacteria bacterium]
MSAITWLASDELQGRYTLAPEIETTASWLIAQRPGDRLGPARRLRAAARAYALRTDVAPGPEQVLTIAAPGKPGKPVAATDFGRAGRRRP